MRRVALRGQVETELQYTLCGSPEQNQGFLDRFCAARGMGEFVLGVLRVLQIEDAYFDTPDGRLASLKMRLRQRRIDGVSYLTLKQKRNGEQAQQWLQTRTEWHVPATEENLQQLLNLVEEGGVPLSRTEAPGLDAFLLGRPCHGLAPIFRIQTVRHERPVSTAAGIRVAHAVLDRLTYPGLSEEWYHAAEIEQEAGSEALLPAIGKALVEMSEGLLQPKQIGKFERACQMKQGEIQHEV